MSIERVYILNLKDQVFRAGLTVGNLLTQNVPEDIIELYPACDGRNLSLTELIDKVVEDGFPFYNQYYIAKETWREEPSVIDLAIQWSYLNIFRTIQSDISQAAMLLLDDCMLDVNFWDLNPVVHTLMNLNNEPLKFIQLGRWTPAFHKFDEPVPIATAELPLVTRITKSLAFGEYGMIITPLGAKVLSEAMQSRIGWLFEYHLVELQGEGVYSICPPVIKHEWYKKYWTENVR